MGEARKKALMRKGEPIPRDKEGEIPGTRQNVRKKLVFVGRMIDPRERSYASRRRLSKKGEEGRRDKALGMRGGTSCDHADEHQRLCQGGHFIGGERKIIQS